MEVKKIIAPNGDEFSVLNRGGDTFWYHEQDFHREDGPAVIYGDGRKEWYLNGKRYDEERYNQEMYKRNLNKLNESK